ncbi:hypothetical protein [Planctomicrobium sp. SH664]|uniref:hypothetical protein n=1 Tax=Planctomicrobium sp. SH664 TaxID=3448125 RepID=UPI003F5CB3C0
MSSTVETDLEEQFFPTHQARLQRWLPWLRLFQAFRIAIDYRRMFLALLAVWIWAAGDRMVTSALLGTTAPAHQHPWPSESEILQGPAFSNGLKFSEMLTNPWGAALKSTSGGEVLLGPLHRMLNTAGPLLHPENSFPLKFAAGCLLLWGLLITGLFGGSISRMTAIEIAGEGEGSLLPSLRYTRRHLLSFLGAPALAFIGMLVFIIPLRVTGWVSAVPLLGDLLLALAWPILLAFGICLALLVVALTLGWPLMVAAVNTEGSDAFDALSRAFSYLFNRPWYALFLTLLSTLYGATLLFFVGGILVLGLRLTVVGLGYASFAALPMQSPEATGFAAQIMGFWKNVIQSVPTAFVFSYFWTTATIIYFLLRHREDGVPLSEVAGTSKVPRAELPVVGIPAALQREQAIAGSSDAGAAPTP